jgi:hypothetical protein
MGNTLITFEDKYYEYDGNCDVYDKGLTIGGYESAWLADLVAAFVLENTQHMFKMTTFNGIYRDDSLVVMKGNWSKQDITNWLRDFRRNTKAYNLRSAFGAQKKRIISPIQR